MQDTRCILHSTLQLLCKAISCPNSATCALRNSCRSSVTCQLLFHMNKNRTLINFSKLPNKNFYENPYKAWVHICRCIQTSTMKLRDILLQLFITSMPKKLLDLSWKSYQALSSVVEQLKSTPNLLHECTRDKYTYLASLCNIKVKQEFKLSCWI